MELVKKEKTTNYHYSMTGGDRIFLIGLLATLQDEGEIKITDLQDKKKVKELLQSVKNI